MIILYRPSILGVFDARQFAHLQVIGRSVFNVAVCGDDLEHSNQTIAGQMDKASVFSNFNLADDHHALDDLAALFCPIQLFG